MGKAPQTRPFQGISLNHKKKHTMSENLNAHWQSQSIDDDNAVVSDSFFVLQYPDAETYRELVKRWNHFEAMKQKGINPEAMCDMVEQLEKCKAFFEAAADYDKSWGYIVDDIKATLQKAKQ